jgi:hypothetical protein
MSYSFDKSDSSAFVSLKREETSLDAMLCITILFVPNKVLRRWNWRII